MLKSLLLPILIAGNVPQERERVVEGRPTAITAAAPRGDALLQSTMLTTHNAARARVGQPPLTWDPALAADAAGYAREMARTGRFEHLPVPRGSPAQGENLWSGTRGAYRYDEMAQDWIDEGRRVVNRSTPGSGTNGTYGDLVHYAQIVSSRTTRFGCAMAETARNEYLVCRYLPA